MNEGSGQDCSSDSVGESLPGKPLVEVFAEEVAVPPVSSPKSKRSRAKKASSPPATSILAEQAGLAAVVAREVRGDTDLPRDIIWAYQNMGNRRMKEADAPSNGAWELLKHAREYRKAFYEQLLPKALAVREKQDKEKRESEGRVLRDKTLPELERLMRETLGR